MAQFVDVLNNLTFQQWYVLGVLLLAIVFFMGNWLRFDVVAILVLVAVVVPSVFFPRFGVIAAESPQAVVERALEGFSSPTIVILASIFVIARALQRAGFSDVVADALQRYTGKSEKRLFGLLLAVIGGLSAVINNTAVTAMSIPVVVRCASRLGTNPSRIYLPLAYVSLVGGVMTLIGTTTNIAVSSALSEASLQPLGMFEMTAVGALFTLAAGVALFVASPFFFPKTGGESLFGKYNVKEFLSEILVKTNSEIIGRPLHELHFGHDYDITIMGVVRDGKTVFSPPQTMAVRAGDVFMVQGGVEDIISLRKEKRLELVNELTVEQGTLRSLDLFMAEVVLLPNSSFIGRTIRDIDLRDNYGITILAFARRGLQRVENLADIPLRMGDTLLVQGHLGGIDRLRQHPNLLVLETLERQLSYRRLPVALSILGVLVVACALQAPEFLFVNFLVAVLALLAARCIPLRDLYESIDWRMLVLIGGMIPLGTAVADTRLVSSFEHLMPADPWFVLGAVYVVTFLLTQIVSNVVSATLMAPIAVGIAQNLDIGHRPLVMAVAFAASFSFITPYGHQACTLVMGPGNYKTSDYLKLGSFLGIVLFLLALWLIPIFFPF